MMMRAFVAALAVVVLAGCPSGGPVAGLDGGSTEVTTDAGQPVADAGAVAIDAGTSAVDAGAVDAGPADSATCTSFPTTYLQIINACTDAGFVEKHPVLPLLLPDGGRPTL